MADYYLGLGDLRPNPNAKLEWEFDGSLPPDLSGATGKFIWRPQGSTAAFSVRDATIVIPNPPGVVINTYGGGFLFAELMQADIDAGLLGIGVFECWWPVRFPGGRQVRFPNNRARILEVINGVVV